MCWELVVAEPKRMRGQSALRAKADISWVSPVNFARPQILQEMSAAIGLPGGQCPADEQRPPAQPVLVYSRISSDTKGTVMIIGLASGLAALFVSVGQQSAPQLEIHPETLQKQALEPIAPVEEKIQNVAATTVSTSSVIGGGEAERLTASQSRSTHRAQIATESDLTGAGLSNFAFGFYGSDHKIRQISVLQTEGKADIAFADQDSNDEFSFHGAWWKAHYPMSEVTAVGRGEFDIEIPSGPTGYVPVLGGFSFEREPQTDANIRAIGVRITPDHRRVRFTLIDDQGLDLRGFETYAVTGLALSSLPFGTQEATFANMAVASASLLDKELSKDGLRPFAATAQIAWVPPDSILKTASLSGANRFYESGTPPSSSERDSRSIAPLIRALGHGEPVKKHKVVLTGFVFSFGNGDHHLRNFGVHLNSDQSKSSISFEDWDQNDPIQWYVDYVEVK